MINNTNKPMGIQILQLKDKLTKILADWDPFGFVEWDISSEQELVVNEATLNLKFDSTDEEISAVFKNIGETFTYDNMNVLKNVSDQIKLALAEIKAGENND